MRLALLLALLSLNYVAAQIEVLDADEFAYRPITLPDGNEGELVVISGSPVRLRIDDDEITAEYIEFDRESNLLRIVGAGDFAYDDIATSGEDYVINLATEEFSVQDVFIFTAPIDIQGVSAERLPGQINVTAGAFSPCSRCNQETQDYSFRAERMRFYPGDRLVAFDVTVLVRDAPILFLPILVVPLGPPERQPRFSISQGTGLVSQDNGAEVALDWPYVLGANAFGTTSLRYYADVTPGEGNGLTGALFGGRVDRSYFGGGFEHTFFTEQGRGELDFFYTPAFQEDEDSGDEEPEFTQNEFSFRFAYDTEERLEIPQLNVEVERDDAETQRIGTYGVTYTTPLFENTFFGLDARFFTQGYYDFDRNDEVTLPAYADRGTPELTYGQVTLGPAENASFSVGPFTLSELSLDLGVFEDASSPNNRSAAQTPKATAGRLVESHRLSLDTLEPLPGFTISGATDFQGQYYTTGERFVDWDSDLTAAQDFGVGDLSLTLTRDVSEGETPFRFDASGVSQTRTDLASSLNLVPADWVRFGANQTYVFTDTRLPEEVGAGPLETELSLFGNLSWLEVSLENTYDIEENDPGTLDVTTQFSLSEGSVEGRLSYEQVTDLRVEDNRTDGAPENDTETTVTAAFGYASTFSVDLSGGYDYDFEDEDEDDDGDDQNAPLVGAPKPLELGATLGDLEQDDTTPGLRVSYARDLASSETEEIAYELTGRVGPIEASLEQTFDFDNDSADDTRYSLLWRDVVSAEATGFTLVSPSLLGLETEGESEFGVSLRDETEEDTLWELSYSTTFDPDLGTLAGDVGGFENTQLELLVDLPQTYLWDGSVGFSVEFSADLLLADDRLARTYLDSAELTLFADLFTRVGIQGRLEYDAQLSGDELVSSTLEIDEFGVTTRITDELYVSAFIDDFWDFTGTNPEQSPYTFQPTLYVVWDRCCWALYGSYDTEDGTLTVAIGFPGEDEGFQQALNTGLALPRRGAGREE